jgi:glycosyltransferase involved in cell wall biosynthesis
MMRIVQVSVGSVRMPPREGSAPLQVIFNTSKQLAKLGHQVVILDRKYSKSDPPLELIEGIEIARLSIAQIPFGEAQGLIRFAVAEFNAILFAVGVSNYLRKNSARIDIIHIHLTSIGLILSLLNMKLRGKMFYTCHLGEWGLVGQRLGLFERIHLFLDPYLMRRISKVIALNETAKQSFISRGKVRAENVVVVHNGVDTSYFKPNVDVREVAKKYDLEGRYVVLFVGRLAKIKGVECLIKAADMLVNRFGHSNTVFILVGPPSFDATEKPMGMDVITKYLEQHQISKNVILTGSLRPEEVRILYAASDIFVLPSLAEGDPLVTVEAMASGKPVIGTKVGGITHQIRDGWNGFLVEPENEEQLAEKIKYLLDNPAERKRMGENSRRYAEEEFDWQRVAKRLLAVYQSNQHWAD